MALIVPVAGPYTSTHTPGANAAGGGGGAVSLGILSDDGFRLGWVIHKQKIGPDGTDRYGLSKLENVVRGADWTILFRNREYGTGVMNAAFPHGKTTGNAGLAPSMGQAGTCDDTSGFTGVLALTAVAGTPAAANPATLTASKAVQSDGQQQAMDFTSKLREVPQQMELLPYASGGAVVWFVTT